ncbi:type II secretion system protein N [Kordiimonas sp.]|uniref:type II secretion system protein N n=1 Tax=Kordiimonas sp. TaxID=1970157 RepID=UPI003A93997F
MKNKVASMSAMLRRGDKNGKVRRKSVQTKGPHFVQMSVLIGEICAVVLLAYIAVQFSYALMAPTPGGAATTSSSKAAKPTPMSDFTVLTSFDPFYRAVADAAPALDEAAPESSLKIALYGVRADGEGGGSAITSSGDAQKLVRVGEELAPGVTLQGVYADRVEISRRGIREAVYLRPKGKRQSVRQPTRQSVAQNAATPKMPQNDMLAELSALKLEPVRRSGRLAGFRVNEKTDATLAAQFRLIPDDILMAVNGSPLTSFERLAELAEEFKHAKNLTFEIERNGALVTEEVTLR